MKMENGSMERRRVRDERGFALAFALLFMIAVAALAAGAFAMTSSSNVLARTAERHSQLVQVAESGLELARVLITADPGLYPVAGYTTIEDGVAIEDVDGNEIPGVQRWLYVGPSGITTGQFGVFGMVVSVVRDGGGGVVIRRSQLYQESFARYAYFTDLEQAPGGQTIYFTGGDQLNGPVHSNDSIRILNPTPIFMAEVRSAGTIAPSGSGDFRQGFQENVTPIELPGTAELNLLRAQAITGGTYFDPPDRADLLPTLRLDFLPIDLDGDGLVTGPDEGFFRAYQLNATHAQYAANGPRYLMAQVPMAPVAGIFNSWNCGRHLTPSGNFQPASGVALDSLSYDRLRATTGIGTCYLGGDPRLFGNTTAGDQVPTVNATDLRGTWLSTPPAISSTVSSAVSGRADTDFLFPTTRTLNPEFRGVIFVEGSVAISGQLRGRITIAATGHIYIADDLTYATSPGGGTCEDILGLFSQEEVRIADNTRNHRFRIPAAGGGRPIVYVDRGNPNGTTVDGIVLALESFTTENFHTVDYQSVLNGSVGLAYFRDCEASGISTQPWGRGCLYLTGGIIQRVRAPVAQLTGGVRYTGYAKRYDYDQCGATAPPPYYPTTGRFFQGQVYQMDPVGFEVDAYFAALQN